MSDVNLTIYRERMGLSYEQLRQEPVIEVNKALLIWSLQADRAKLEEERAKARQQHP